MGANELTEAKNGGRVITLRRGLMGGYEVRYTDPMGEATTGQRPMVRAAWNLAYRMARERWGRRRFVLGVAPAILGRLPAWW
jgi:hypothetical protein